MPLFAVPSLSLDKYHDGGDVLPGDRVVPCLLVTDGNDKVTVVSGDTVDIVDLRPPVVSGLAVQQAEVGGNPYHVRPSAGTATDLTRGSYSLHFFVSPGALSDADALAAVGDPGVRTHVRSGNTPGSLLDLASVQGDLAVSAFRDGSAVAQDSGTVHPFLVAVDDSGNSAVYRAGAVAVLDLSAPGVSALSLATQSPASLGVSVTSTEGGAVHLAVLESALPVSAPSPADVRDGTGPFSAAERSSVAVSAGTAASASVAVSPAQPYHVYAVSQDDAGNLSETVRVVASDADAPTGTGGVSLALGPSPGSQIVVSGLSGVGDAGSGLASIEVFHAATATKPGSGTAVSMSGGAAQQDALTLSGLDGYREYFVWVDATDVRGNAAAAGPLSITTADVVPPTLPGSFTLTALSSTEIEVSGLAGIADAASGLAAVSVLYGTTNVIAAASEAAVAVSAGVAADSTTLSGLQPGTEYFVWVRATDSAASPNSAVTASPQTASTDSAEAEGGGGAPAAPAFVSPFPDDLPTDPVSSWAAASYNSSGSSLGFLGSATAAAGGFAVPANAGNGMIMLNTLPSTVTDFVAQTTFSVSDANAKSGATTKNLYLNPIFGGSTSDYGFLHVNFQSGAVRVTDNTFNQVVLSTPASVFATAHTLEVRHMQSTGEVTYTIYDASDNGVVESVTFPLLRPVHSSGVRCRFYVNLAGTDTSVTVTGLNLAPLPRDYSVMSSLPAGWTVEGADPVFTGTGFQIDATENSTVILGQEFTDAMSGPGQGTLDFVFTQRSSVERVAYICTIRGHYGLISGKYMPSHLSLDPDSFYFRNFGSSGSGLDTKINGITLEDDREYRITIVHDGAVLKTYIDNVLRHTYSSQPTAEYPVKMGNGGGGPSQLKIDHIQLFGHALAESEVAALPPRVSVETTTVTSGSSHTFDDVLTASGHTAKARIDQTYAISTVNLRVDGTVLGQVVDTNRTSFTYNNKMQIRVEGRQTVIDRLGAAWKYIRYNRATHEVYIDIYRTDGTLYYSNRDVTDPGAADYPGLSGERPAVGSEVLLSNNKGSDGSTTIVEFSSTNAFLTDAQVDQQQAP